MKHILVVDDHKDVRDLIALILDGAEDYQVAKVECGEKAVEISKKKRLDLVIMDVVMPEGIDGYSATKSIKQHSINQELKIIMVTAMGHDMDIRQGIKAGADAYIVKPFSPVELIDKVDRMLKSLE